MKNRPAAIKSTPMPSISIPPKTGPIAKPIFPEETKRLLENSGALGAALVINVCPGRQPEVITNPHKITKGLN